MMEHYETLNVDTFCQKNISQVSKKTLAALDHGSVIPTVEI